MVERFEKFSYLISELSKLLHKIEADVLSELGIKGPYAIYILTLAKYKEGISASKISEEHNGPRQTAVLTATGL